MGINTGRVPEELALRAASVSANRTLLAARITDEFFEAYDVFLERGLSEFIGEFGLRNCLKGRITIDTGKDEITGEFCGFDEYGALLLDCAGERKRFVSGEVTARGERGYV